MANNEAKIKFTADTADLNSKLKNVNSVMAAQRAELKLNEAQFKNTGNEAEYLKNKQQILTTQLTASQDKVKALSDKLEIAKQIFGENSNEVLALQRQLVGAMTEEERLKTSINQCNTELKQHAEASEKVETGTEQLTNKISQQEKELSQLKGEYTEAVLKFGTTSKEAKQLAKEIDTLSGELKSNKTSLNTAEKAADELDDSFDEVEKSAGKVGDRLKKIGGTAAKGVAVGLTAIATAGTAVVGTFLGSAEATREYREDMGKLQTAFQSSGKTAEQATNTYKSFYSVLGEEDRSVEAVNHLTELTDSQKELDKWSNICAGVVGTFGDSLPIEGLTEAANETAKVGKVTGPLADALNWVGISEDEFNKKLEKCNSEQERATLITDTLNTTYEAASEKYKTLNKDIMDAQTAQSEFTDSMADIGAAAEPVMTSIKLLGAGVLEDLSPSVALIGEGLSGAMNGAEGSAGTLAKGVGGALNTVSTTLVSVINQVVTILPELMQQLLPTIVAGLVSIMDGIVDAFPGIMSAILLCLPALISGVEQLITSLVGALPALVQTLVNALPTLIPTLIDSVVNIIVTICEQFSSIIQPLIEALPDVIITIVEALMNNLPALISGIITLVLCIVEATPQIIQGLVDALPTVISLIIDGLLSALPQIIVGLIQVVIGIVKSLPQIFGSLIQGIVNIFSGIWDGLGKVFGKVGTWFGDKFGGAVEGIKGAFAGIGNFFSGIWTGITNAFGNVAGWFGGVFTNAWTAVKNVFSKGGQIFLGIKDGILGGLKTVINGLISGINRVIKIPFDGINTALRTIKGINILGAQPFSWIGEIGIPQIPQLYTGGLATGPTIAVVGDNPNARINPEVIAPLNQLNAMISDNIEAAVNNNASQMIFDYNLLANIMLEAAARMNIEIKVDKRTLGRVVRGAT